MISKHMPEREGEKQQDSGFGVKIWGGAFCRGNFPTPDSKKQNK